jgi:hypothetical protein
MIPEQGTHTVFKRAVLETPFKFPAAHWERVLCMRIIDAEGWRWSINGQFESNWKEPITCEEFLARAAELTTHCPRGFIEWAKRVTPLSA